jgi:hypothetical protein
MYGGKSFNCLECSKNLGPKPARLGQLDSGNFGFSGVDEISIANQGRAVSLEVWRLERQLFGMLE